MYFGKEIKTLEELRERLEALAEEIRDVEKACGYDPYPLSQHGQVSVDPDRKDAEALFLRGELCRVLYRLDQAADGVEYLRGEVKAVGVLRKTPTARYAVAGWPELDSGSVVELLIDDRFHKVEIDGKYQCLPFWRSGRIVYVGEDYYFTGTFALDMPLEGVKARIRC